LLKVPQQLAASPRSAPANIEPTSFG